MTKRDFEKQELERVWWESLDIPWKIFLNDNQDKIVANNLCWLSQPLRDGNQKAKSETADAHIVSPLNRTINLGRPTIYSIVDRASRMIVGLYVSLGHPSWEEARLVQR